MTEFTDKEIKPTECCWMEFSPWSLNTCLVNGLVQIDGHWYRQASNVSHTLAANEIGGHSNVVGQTQL